MMVSSHGGVHNTSSQKEEDHRHQCHSGDCGGNDESLGLWRNWVRSMTVDVEGKKVQSLTEGSPGWWSPDTFLVIPSLSSSSQTRCPARPRVLISLTTTPDRSSCVPIFTFPIFPSLEPYSQITGYQREEHPSPTLRNLWNR